MIHNFASIRACVYDEEGVDDDFTSNADPFGVIRDYDGVES